MISDYHCCLCSEAFKSVIDSSYVIIIFVTAFSHGMLQLLFYGAMTLWQNTAYLMIQTVNLGINS